MDSASTSNPLSHTYADTGTYQITLITATQYGCGDTAHQTVIIEPDFVLYIPNAFAPNGKKYIVVILATRPYNSPMGKDFIQKASNIIYTSMIKGGH